MKHQILYYDRETVMKEIKKLDKQISYLPPGDLSCVTNGKYTKWYRHLQSTTEYIPKRNRKLAEALALKKYYSLQKNELEMRLESMNAYFTYLEDIEQKASDLLSSSSGFGELLRPHLSSCPKEPVKWKSEDYPHNHSYPENLIHETYAGIKVRSKSEVLIANELFTNQIPFRYECGIYLDDTLYFPDFTICHPNTMEIFYWEHFGMMDQQAYRSSAYSKLKIYGNHNIIPAVNLITTYETKDCPVNSQKINSIIREYFIS